MSGNGLAVEEQGPVSEVSDAIHGARRALPNAIWNGLRALATAIVGFCTTPILLRTLSHGDYAGWVLVSSVTSYLTITDIGLSTEVVRATATARSEGDDRNGFDTVKAVTIIQGWFTLSMLLLLVGVTVVFPHLFTDIPQASIRRAQWALVVLGLTSLVQMGLNPLVAHQIGMERLDIGAKCMIVSRVGVFAWIVATASRGLAVVASGVAVLYTVAFVISAAWVYRIKPGFSLRTPFFGASPYKPVIAFARRRLVWFLGYFAAITFDVTIVGRYAYRDLVPFGLATSLAIVASMAYDAVMATLLPQIPGPTGEALPRFFRSFFAFALASAALVVLGLALTSVIAVPLWVGHVQAPMVLHLLFPMLAVTFVRLVLDGATVFLIVRNEQRLCTWNHVLEAAVKLPIGVVLVQRYGAIGLIWAGLAGALLGMVLAVYRAIQTSQVSHRIRFGFVPLVYSGVLLGVLMFARSAHRPLQFVVILVVGTGVAVRLLASGALGQLGIVRTSH